MQPRDWALRITMRTLPWAMAVAVGCAALPAAVAAPSPDEAQAGARYFIDFRARPSGYIGHTFVVYGRLDAQGHAIERHVAGLIPDRAAWRGVFFPIKGSVRKYKDDELLPPTVIYRLTLTRREYGRVLATVRQMRTVSDRWHAIFFNCNDFAIEIAEELGLAHPPSLLPPAVWVTGLRNLNRR
jgi:hypothetical protein